MAFSYKIKIILLIIVVVGIICNHNSIHNINKYTSNHHPNNHIDPTPEIAKIIPESCRTNCATDFNTILGENSNVIGFSNCNAYFCSNFEDGPVMIKKEALGTKEDIFSGIRWQCVEYARRWLIINKRFTFEGVDSSYQIWDLNTVSSIDDDRRVKFSSYKNDSGVPPKLGDLLIVDKDSKNPHGHVAIIVDANLEKGYIDVAEQNNFNTKWENKNYSRRIKLFTKTKDSIKSFYLTELSYEEHYNKCQSSNDLRCHSEYSATSDNLIIGWKRIEDSQ